MVAYPKRLIEVDLPIKRISEHARPEKTTVHGNISTLHVWWARRPLAACRAVICAALWPDPADPLCPQRFRDDACRLINDFARKAAADKELAEHCSEEVWAKWQTLARNGGLEPKNEDHWNILRNSLLDFIADFANWDNSTVPEYLAISRALTQSAHEVLGGEPGTRPLVVDPFAGGGAIPLESLRIGADAFASDLNPIAVLLNKVILEFIPHQADLLSAQLDHWAAWIKNGASKELISLYPCDPDGGRPLVFLWARTVQCEGPTCGFTIPLIRTLNLGGGQQLTLRADPAERSFTVSVKSSKGSAGAPTVKGGSVTCPDCGYTTPAKSVRDQLTKRRGGSKDPRLLAVLVENDEERRFRSPQQYDLSALEMVPAVDESVLPTGEINPIRPHKNTRGVSAVTRIGMTRFTDLYTQRQLRALEVFSKTIQSAVREAGTNLVARQALTILGLCFGRLIQQNSTCARWRSKAFAVAGSFGKQALQVVWDFAETTPLSGAAGSWDNAVEWARKIIAKNRDLAGEGTATQSPAQLSPLPSECASLLFTDPPYFAAIPYADLANFFYVWERKVFIELYPELFITPMVNQCQEIIVTEANPGPNSVRKDEHFFQGEMTASLRRAREALNASGLGVIVFADTRTSSWEALLGAVIESDWVITASWPIDTEHQNRTQAQGSASLQSSIHLVCRPRQKHAEQSHIDSSGDWRDVLAELPGRIHDWMPRLSSEGVVGADAIFACLGPALEIFSRYSRVEKASGEPVTLKEYLEYVWAAVAKEALNMIFEGADATGFEEDSRLTAMWLWTLSTGTNGDRPSSDEPDGEEQEEEGPKKTQVSGYVLEYDAARKIAQGLGAHLERLTSLVEIKGETARLLPVSERARHLFGKDEGAAPTKRKAKPKQLSFADVLDETEEEGGWGEKNAPKAGSTVLDRVHQSMILFAAGRNEALKRFLVTDGAGQDRRFWHLADALCKLYPPGTDERRWVEGVMARKKGLGF